jgi:hypothetical protein
MEGASGDLNGPFEDYYSEDVLFIFSPNGVPPSNDFVRQVKLAWSGDGPSSPTFL